MGENCTRFYVRSLAWCSGLVLFSCCRYLSLLHGNALILFSSSYLHSFLSYYFILCCQFDVCSLLISSLKIITVAFNNLFQASHYLDFCCSFWCSWIVTSGWQWQQTGQSLYQSHIKYTKNIFFFFLELAQNSLGACLEMGIVCRYSTYFPFLFHLFLCHWSRI